MSMTVAPAAMPSSTPSGPVMTSVTWGEEGTQVMTTSERAATPAALAPAWAPAAASSSTAGRLRFQTVSGKPALSRLRHIGWPMAPNPIKPTRVVPVVIALFSSSRSVCVISPWLDGRS